MSEPERVSFLDFHANERALELFRQALSSTPRVVGTLEQKWAIIERLWNSTEEVILVPHSRVSTGALLVPFWYVGRYRENLRTLFGGPERGLHLMSTDGSRGASYQVLMDLADFEDKKVPFVTIWSNEGHDP
jgi:hypothetical protein